MTVRQCEFILLAAGIGCSIIVGLFCLMKFTLRSGLFVLSPMRVRAVPWSSGWCVAVFVVLWGLPMIVSASGFKVDAKSNEKTINQLTIGLAMLPLQLAIIGVGFRVMGAIWPLGVHSRADLFRDAALGWTVWLLITPPTLLLHIVVRDFAERLRDPAIHSHKLIESLTSHSHDTALWALAIVEAAIAAPIREELFFRGTMQPWLSRREWGGDLAVVLAMLAPLIVGTREFTTWSLLAPAAFVAIAATAFWQSESALVKLRNRMGRLGRALFPDLHGSVSGRDAFRGVVGVSLLFAAFHSASWPDPIPLTITGLGLGWLGWRTQGILAPLVCHVLFNSVMLALLRWDMLTHATAS